MPLTGKPSTQDAAVTRPDGGYVREMGVQWAMHKEAYTHNKREL